MGLPYFKVHVDSSHTFLVHLWAEAMVLVEIMTPPARLALASKVADTHDLVADVETLEEKR